MPLPTLRADRISGDKQVVLGLKVVLYVCNFGSVDSIAMVLYCAGSRHLCVPRTRFLIHPVQFNIRGNARYCRKPQFPAVAT